MLSREDGYGAAWLWSPISAASVGSIATAIRVCRSLYLMCAH